MIKVIFFSSSKRALSILKSLIDDKDIEVSAVVTQPDRVRGKNQAPSPTPVKQYALDHQIPVLTPKTLKDNADFLNEMKKLNPDLIVVVYYALLLPSELLEIPKLGGINIHPSLLPQYPGSSPAQWAIARGEKVSGVSIIKMTEKFDEGPIIEQWEIPIEPDETSESLYYKSFAQTAEKLPKIIKNHDKWTNLIGTNLDNTTAEVFYARRLKKDDGRIDWSEPPEMIERKVRAFSPWPGTWTTMAKVFEHIKLNNLIPGPDQESIQIDLDPPIPEELRNGASKPEDDKVVGDATKDNKKVKIIKAHIEQGKLVIDRLQVEGKRETSWEEFERGYIK